MKQGKWKEIVRANGIPVLMTAVFCVLGIILVRNEIFMDDWYIESSADGLFGNDNRSVFTLGANFIFMGIIWLASLTGIRLSWIHVFMLIMNTISSFIIFKTICSNLKTKLKYIIACILLLYITPLMNFYMQFTTTASYTVAAGCLLLFFCHKNKLKKGYYILGGCWVVLGSCLRYDALYFSIAFMGSIGLVKVIQIFMNEKGKKSRQEILKELSSFLMPFLIVLGISVLINITQGILVNKYCPGFSEWNSVRTQVDDYAIPDYNKYPELYEDQGISYNDYQLLKSWNNLDENYFTEELYQKILLMQTNDDEVQVSLGKVLVAILIKAVRMIRSNYCSILMAMGLFTVILFYDRYAIFAMSMLVGVMLALESYFLGIGRLIWRTEWPVYMVGLVAVVVVITCFEQRTEIIQNKKVNKKAVLLLEMIIMVIGLFTIPQETVRDAWDAYNGKSIYNIYREKIESQDIYGRYLIGKILGKEEKYYATIDRQLIDYTQDNKDKLFYHLIQSDWLQVNPLTNKDLFRTAPVASGQNWCILGQYMRELHPLKYNETKYGVNDTFRDLTNDNVRVVAQKHEIVERTKELTNYLKEHYGNTDFSVVDVLDNTVIGCFVSDIEVKGEKHEIGGIDLEVVPCSEINGMVELSMTNMDFFNYIPGDKVYLQLESVKGDRHTFWLNFDSNYLPYAIVYNDVLEQDMTYTVSIVVQHKEKCTIYEGQKDIVLENK